MSGALRQPPDGLDRYLDGQLTGEELAVFEQAISADPALREEVDRQRRIDASLRRAFAPQPATAPLPIDPRRGVLRRIGWVAAAAAVVAIGAAAAWPLLFPPPAKLGGTSIARGPKLHEPAESYKEILDQGFVPYTVCESDAQFADYTRTKFDEALRVKDPGGIEVVGWVYEQRVLSQSTLSLLVKQGANRIVVFLDRKAHDRNLALPADSNLHLFRREVGGVVMYEISPAASETVIPRIVQATN